MSGGVEGGDALEQGAMLVGLDDAFPFKGKLGAAESRRGVRASHPSPTPSPRSLSRGRGLEEEHKLGESEDGEKPRLPGSEKIRTSARRDDGQVGNGDIGGGDIGNFQRRNFRLSSLEGGDQSGDGGGDLGVVALQLGHVFDEFE